jgi:hypothetical protein
MAPRSSSPSFHNIVMMGCPNGTGVSLNRDLQSEEGFTLEIIPLFLSLDDNLQILRTFITP